jgi:hypothetical protein
MISRRQFLTFAAAATVRLKLDTTDTGINGDVSNERSVRLEPDQKTGEPRGSEFVFARLPAITT